jgi:F-type H+-transporting ATPase subunit delta
MTAQQYALALYQAISEVKPADHDKVLENFVKILSSNGDLGQYPQIEQEYKKVEAESQGIKQVNVLTANKDINTKALVAELNRIVGNKVEINHETDEKIIGGVVIKVDDTLIDASVRNSLENLKKDLTHNSNI